MNEEEIKVVKTASCPSLSERSTLTYHVGCMGDRSIYLRIYENTGKGIFSKDWITLAELDPILTSEEKPITSGLIRTLFKGKSVNSAGFILAALIAEGLIKISKDSLRSYERADPTEFTRGIQALLDADNTPPSNEEKSVKVKKTMKSNEEPC